MKPKKQEAMMAARGYLSVRYVAQKLGRTPQAVYQMIVRGKLRTLHVGNRTLYVDRASLIEHLGTEAAALFGFGAARQPADAA